METEVQRQNAKRKLRLAGKLKSSIMMTHE